MTMTDVLLPALIEEALRAATRAPSVHNTQPWRFAVTSSVIELHLDRTRLLPATDPGAREARISCGAALFNLRLAVRTAGREAVVTLLPDLDQPDLLARVRVGAPRPVTVEERTLAAAIDRRASNRHPFTDRAVPLVHRRALRRAAKEERAALFAVDTPRALGILDVLLRRANHLQEADPAFRDELREWTDGNGDRKDGVPRSAGTPRPAGGVRVGAGLSPVGRQPAVMILTTRGDTALDHLRAGMAMQHTLLTATALGMRVSLLTQPVEIAYTRVALRTLLATQGNPQALLRIGYAEPAAGTSRRPVASVTNYPSHPTI
jgi:nitroreductase family protein